jgi:hypothetical protein
MNWKATAIAGWIVILVAAAFAAGVVVSGKLGSRSSTPPVASASPFSEPSLAAAPSPVPAPSPSPPPSPAHFVTVSTDWQGCFHTEHPQQPPICLGHGVFENVGGTAGGAEITFAVPNGSASCTTATAVVPPQSVAQASCDLGYAGENYWAVHSGGPGTNPMATITNP